MHAACARRRASWVRCPPVGDGRVGSAGPRWRPLRRARDPRAHATHLTDPPCPGASLTHGTSPPRGPPRGGDTRGGGGKGASARAPPFWPMPQGGKRAKSRPRSYPHRVLPPLPGPSQGTLEKNPPPRAGSFQEGLKCHPCRGSTDLGPDLEKSAHRKCATGGHQWPSVGSSRIRQGKPLPQQYPEGNVHRVQATAGGRLERQQATPPGATTRAGNVHTHSNHKQGLCSDANNIQAAH